MIGHLNALATFGAIAFLLIGAPWIARLGSLRSLQVGCTVATLGTVLYVIGSPYAVVAATLLIGMGYGPSPAAGSDVLQRYSPPDRRNLIFSIKQAGVPIGGVLAGLVLPPLLERSGIGGVVLFAVAFGLVAVVAVQPLRAEIDADRSTNPVSIGSLFSSDNLLGPFRAVMRTPSLHRLALAGTCLSASQGIWFTFLVTFLVVVHGHSLALAGAVFALMQFTGIFGRVVLGVAADRIGSGLPVLAVMGVTSAICSLVLAASSAAWPGQAIFALAAFAGIAVSSWNGVHIAESVKLADGDVRAAAAGATAITFCGYLGGPMLFALMLAAGGRYEHGFVAVAVVGLVGSWLSLAARRT
jgi:predicted MFS family arabinose efflux permease